MKVIFTSVIFLFCISLSAQNVQWRATLDPQKVFIENKSQFTNCLKQEKNKNVYSAEVLFATEDAPFQVLFTKQGLIYRLEKRERVKVDEEEIKEGINHEEMEKKEHEAIITSAVVLMQWKNANAAVEVSAENMATQYYNYKTKNGSMRASAYQKIVYRNLYPHIDVEYVFHPRQGIEYSFVLHPGADASLIKMEYSGMSAISVDGKNNIHLKTIFGDIVDHAPRTFYSAGNSEVDSKFSLNQKIISIDLAAYNHSRELIIDPWTVNPPMGNSNKVFCIEGDSSGNAYIYGGDSPYKLQKYNAVGALQWTYTNGWDSSTYWVGALIVDRAGNSYVTSGSAAGIAKVNTSGGQVWINPSSLFSVDEYWSLAFNCDETELITGGTRLTGLPPFFDGSGRVYSIDLTNGNVLNGIRVSNAIPSFLINDPNEVRSVCSSPNGNYYFLTLDTIGSLTLGISSINWEAFSGYRFGYGSPNYGFTPQGQSVIRATATYIFTADGDSIVKRDINTGNVVAAAAIPGGGHATTLFVPGTLPKNGGIDIDSCGNVYVGSQQSVSMFDNNLNFISSTPTPSAVYDVAVGAGGEILACGNGFATSLTMGACTQVHLNCVTNTLPVSAFSAPNTICPGTCTGFTNLSVNATSYQWYFLGGTPAISTDVNPASICYNTPGTYDVALVATNASGSDSVMLANYITVYPYPAPQGIIQSADSLIANQGSVSYQWYQDGTLIPGATDYFYIITSGGNYNVVCTDSNSCEVEAAIFDVVEGMQSINNHQSSFVFPNPVIDKCTIHNTQFTMGADAVITVYNMLGVAVQQETRGKKPEAVINFRSLSNGIYWIEVRDSEKLFRTRVVKQ